MNINDFSDEVESLGFTWDIGWRGRADIEVRIWNWPSVIHRQTVNKSSDIDWACDIVLNKIRATQPTNVESEI